MTLEQVIEGKKVLHLTLKKEPFDMISSGEKKDEYREKKDYWDKRLFSPIGNKGVLGSKKFDLIVFKNGYGSDVPTIVVEHRGTELGYPKAEWLGDPQHKCFIIHLGEVIWKSEHEKAEFSLYLRAYKAKVKETGEEIVVVNDDGKYFRVNGYVIDLPTDFWETSESFTPEELEIIE